MGKAKDALKKQSGLPKLKRSVCKPGRHLAHLSEKERALVCNKWLLVQFTEKLNNIERQRQTNAEGCTTPAGCTTPVNRCNIQEVQDVNPTFDSMCTSMCHMSLD